MNLHNALAHSSRKAMKRCRAPAGSLLEPAPGADCRRAGAAAALLAVLFLLSCSVQNNGPAVEPSNTGKAGGSPAAGPSESRAPSNPAAGEAPAPGGATAAEAAPAAPPRQNNPVPAEGSPEAAPGPASLPPVIKELEAKLRAGAPGDPRSNEAGAAVGPEEEEKFLVELETAVRRWVEDLDAEKAEGELAKLAITGTDLENTIAQGHRVILLGTLLAKNQQVLKTLAVAARGVEVKVRRWSPGKVTRADTGTGLFLKSVPLVSSNMLEILLGKFPVEIELRQVMRLDGTWKVMEFSIKH